MPIASSAPDDASLVPPSKRRRALYNWEESGGLGLGLRAGSDGGSGLSSSASLQATPAKRLVDPTRDAECFVHGLIEVRTQALREGRRFIAQGVLASWVEEQAAALRAGTLSAERGTALGVAGVSDEFERFLRSGKALGRGGGRRPDYWADDFVSIVDHVIEHGHTEVAQSRSKEYAHMYRFLRGMRSKRREGKLPAERERLLTALGTRWDPVRHRKNNRFSEGRTADAPGPLPSPKLAVVNKPTTVMRNQPAATRCAPPPPSNPPPPADLALLRGDNSVSAWIKHFMELRRFHAAHGHDNVPETMPDLFRWVQVQRSAMRCGSIRTLFRNVLLAADFVPHEDEAETFYINFVSLTDFYLCHGHFVTRKNLNKTSSALQRFLHRRREYAETGRLRGEHKALFDGLDEKWSVWPHERRQHVEVERGYEDEVLADEEADDDDEEEQEILNHKLEDNVNGYVARSRATRASSQVADRANERNWEQRERGGLGVNAVRSRRDDSTPRAMGEAGTVAKESASDIVRKVNLMLSGLVGEMVGGRERTAAERDAQRWFNRADVRTLNVYAEAFHGPRHE